MTNDDPQIRHGSGLRRKKLRLWRGADFRETALLGLFRLAIATLPAAQWPRVADGVALLGKGRRSSRYKRFAVRVRAVFGSMDDSEVLGLWQAYAASLNRRRMSVLASRFRPDWQPRIELAGRDHLDRAIAGGRGTILWVDNFIHHPVIGKRGFADAGYMAWQMSSVDHGFSSSRLGRRFLNPIQLAAEEPLMRGRIEFDASSALTATRRAMQCLARNEIVRITNNAFISRQRLEAPIGANAVLPLTTTPLNLAARTGAALLPVAVVEREPFADYLVAVAPPLSPGDPRAGGFEACAAAYARYLEPLVAAYPAQWRGWENVRMAARPD